jgi:ribulose-5-phosphate 4-epimerase/fuculose-1-phosphate aldolase
MAWHTIAMNPDMKFQKELLDKHYLRKHGENAYYGQREKK